MQTRVMLDATLFDCVVQGPANRPAPTSAGRLIDHDSAFTASPAPAQTVDEPGRRATSFYLSVYLWPVILTLSTVAVLILASTATASAVRATAALWFLVVCPGMAAVRLLDLHSWPAEWTLAIALSLALDAAVAEVMVYRGAWSPPHGVAALAAWTLVGSALQIARSAARLRSDKNQRSSRACSLLTGDRDVN